MKTPLQKEKAMKVFKEKDDACLTNIYLLVDQHRVDDATNILFERMDELLSAGKFQLCDDLLRSIDLQRLDTNLVVAVLSITLVAADHLPYRQRFVERAVQRLEHLAPERVDRLLDGLV
jgi:hypothetical protein